MPHIYDKDGERRKYADYGRSTGPQLDDIVNDAVNVGSQIGSSVLSSIAEALASVGDAVSGTQKTDDFSRWRRKLDRKLQNGVYGEGLAMSIVGWLFAGCFGIAALVLGILLGVSAGTGFFAGGADIAFSVLTPIFTVLTAGLAALGWAGLKRVGYGSRLRKYLRVARGWENSVAELSRESMEKPEQVKKDLQKAVSNGDYPDACLSLDTQTLYFDAALYQPEPPASAAPEAGAAPLTPGEQLRREGVDFLGYLRSCTGKLGPDADAELAAMQKNCGAILGFAYNHPEQINRVRRFREYYLPTTRKLLNTAMGLGDAEVENARTIRQDITGILHTMNIAYEKLYDTLLQDVTLDVSTEIDVLESMLSQDGLTHDFASDFGKTAEKNTRPPAGQA